MECIQLRSPPGPFHYLISEQAKSLVALQELQNEVGALLEFRDLVIETFPNLRSKMPPSTPASGTRRDWEPGVRVRRKLAGGTGDSARAKPQPSVQDSGFSTETSCGKDAHSSSASASASASASRPRPLEDELLALLDVIQRKGIRLRDEAELLRTELDERHTGDTAEESFARALSASGGCNDCADFQRLRCERDALLARAAQLEAEAAATPAPTPSQNACTPLGRLDAALETPSRPPAVASPDSKKFAAILLESNPVELQRQLLTSTVQNQVLCEKLRRAAAQRTILLERLERTRDANEDLKFRLEEKAIELEGARACIRQLEGRRRSPSRHTSMRDMEPLPLPDDDNDPIEGEEARISETPRRRPSRIPLKAPAPRPPSAHSVRSVASTRSHQTNKSSVPVRRSSPLDNKKTNGVGREGRRGDSVSRDSLSREGAATPSREPMSRVNANREPMSRVSVSRATLAEYVARATRLAPLFPRLHTVRTRPLPSELALEYRLAYDSPQNLALELSKSILYENEAAVDVKSLASLDSAADSLWNGKPQQYFESMQYGTSAESNGRDYDSDSLAPHS